MEILFSRPKDALFHEIS